MKVISVKFKENGRSYYFDPADLQIRRGDFVIVETARGTECGEVVRGVHEVLGHRLQQGAETGGAHGRRRGHPPHAPETATTSAALSRCASSALPPTAWT